MFQKPPHRPDFCPERKFGCLPRDNPAKLGAAGINPVKNPDISASEGRLITGRMIFTLNPAPGLFLEAFSFSSSRFVQGTTPPKKKEKIHHVSQEFRKAFCGSLGSGSWNFQGG